MIKLRPVGIGKHNNIHYSFTIGSRKNNIISIKLTGFNDTGIAYISNAKFNDLLSFINKDYLTEVIKDKLSKFDFTLFVTDKCWNNTGLTTEMIIDKYNLNATN